MNALLLYCFTEEKPDSELNGWNGTPLTWLKQDDIYVAFHPSLPAQNILESGVKDLEIEKHPAFLYQKATREIHKKARMVPLRFLSIVHSEEAVKKLIRENKEQILGLLEKLGDTCEHSYYLPVKQQTEDVPAALKNEKPAFSYLQKKYVRFQKENQLKVLSEEINKILSSYLADWLISWAIHLTEQAVHIHLLTEKNSKPSEELLELLKVKTGIAPVRTGSYPPFHFVDFQP